MRSPDILVIWTVFANPRDHPGKWVLRGFRVGRRQIQPMADCVVAETLDAARVALPPGVVQLGRHITDDPAIYESWV